MSSVPTPRFPSPEEVLGQVTRPLGLPALPSLPGAPAAAGDALNPLVSLESSLWDTLVNLPARSLGLTPLPKLLGPAETLKNILGAGAAFRQFGGGAEPLAKRPGVTLGEGEKLPTSKYRGM